jgi:hypothetical protein
MKWKDLPEPEREDILAYANENGCTEAAKKYHKAAGYSNTDTFYKYLVQEMAQRRRLLPPPDGLTKEDKDLLQDFAEGKVGYDRIQKELATRVFKKILLNPESVSVRDWLQSELVKLKQDETTKQKDALERFVNSLFGGFIPSIQCPHCGKSTIIGVKELGEVLEQSRLQED